jgi:hypothetical protein
MKIYFTDYFDVSPADLDAYGAFNISLINDLPVFVDPFLLFNSEKDEYKKLHSEIVRYVTFLRDMAAEEGIRKGLLKAWYRFPEVKQTWFGYSRVGNGGSGLGDNFGQALHENLHTIFSDFGNEQITRGSHLEKLCLIKDGVGRDNISDFATNLIKGFLCQYTQEFADLYLDSSRTKVVPVTHVEFNYETRSWKTNNFRLPYIDGDFVLLTPKDILTKDEAWINKHDMIGDFDEVCASLSNETLRAQVNDYLLRLLPKDPRKKEISAAASAALRKFPELIDRYIRYKEDNGDRAIALSEERVRETEDVFIQHVRDLVKDLNDSGAFYQEDPNTYASSLKRVNFLKQVIENNDGYRFFYVKGQPVKRESDLQLMFRLTWYAASEDVNSEVNNGRGPVDYKISRGSRDSTLVEFKLASNSKLRQNLENQVEVYKAANQTPNSIKVIMCFSLSEMQRVISVLNELGLSGRDDVVVIDASRENKESASNVR